MRALLPSVRHVLIAAVLLGVAKQCVAQGYVIDLGTLGGTHSYGYAINDNGQVVGYSRLPGDTSYHAFLWSGGSMTDMGTLGGKSSYAYGIDNSGRVVGKSLVTGNGFL